MTAMTVMPFKFETQKVRVANRDGEPWFVLADVCRALGLAAHKGSFAHHAGKLDHDEKFLADRSSALEGTPMLNMEGDADTAAWVISESGLYTIILRCRDATTEGTVPYRFRKWVTSEVLPSIRRTGQYGGDITKALRDPKMMRNILAGYVDQVIELQAQVGELSPKAEALDRIATAKGSLNLTDAAKVLQVRPKDLRDWMARNGWIYRRQSTGYWLGYQSRVDAGLLEHKVHTVTGNDGRDRLYEHCRVTPKGLAALSKACKMQLELVA